MAIYVLEGGAPALRDVLANGADTLAVYMGVGRMPEITGMLLEGGRPAVDLVHPAVGGPCDLPFKSDRCAAMADPDLHLSPSTDNNRRHPV